jgi:hypothetical protein
MDQHNKTSAYDNDDLRFFQKEPPFWPRMIGIGILVLAAVLLVAYSTYQVLSISLAFIGEQTLNPMLPMAVVWGTILLLATAR